MHTLTLNTTELHTLCSYLRADVRASRNLCVTERQIRRQVALMVRHGKLFASRPYAIDYDAVLLEALRGL